MVEDWSLRLRALPLSGNCKVRLRESCKIKTGRRLQPRSRALNSLLVTGLTCREVASSKMPGTPTCYKTGKG